MHPPRFSEPGLPLRREQAPALFALFALLDELAIAARTKAPDDVYVSATPELFVTETGGGFLGKNSRRVLCIGAPLLATSTVGELRAMLAHELGHYVGGDTRLGGVLAFTEGAFRSVLESTEQSALRADSIHWSVDLGEAFARGVAVVLVKLYAGIYLRLTRPMSRRQELAADALSAELSGRENAVRALEKVHVLGPLYSIYLETEVARVIGEGAMPTDLLAGFERFRTHIDAHGVIAAIDNEAREAKTNPFDSHPALADRVAALRALPEGPPHLLDASGRTLLDGAFDLDAWLVEGTFSSYERTDPKPVARMPWSEIARVVLPRNAHQSGRDVAAALFAKLPEATTLSAMFVSLVRAFEAGRVAEMVEAFEPATQQVPMHQRQALIDMVAGRMVGAVFAAALLEQGAEIDESLGEPTLLFRVRGETVRPQLIASDSMTKEEARHELVRWVVLLASSPPAPPPAPALAASLSG